MTFLLDTHILIWAALRTRKLPPVVAALMADTENEILVSAASAWEIATKVRLGKLAGAEELERDFMVVVPRAGYRLLAIEPELALRAGRLLGSHGDPFDRMIAAQALQLDIPVISADPKLDTFGVRRIW